MFRDAPDGKRIAVRNLGGEGEVAVGVPKDEDGRQLFDWVVARGLTRNDLMILADHVLEVAQTLPWEDNVVAQGAGA